jgi:phosphomannomutase
MTGPAAHPAAHLDADLARAAAWAAGDPNPATRDELRRLAERARGGDAAAAAELHDAVGGDLRFGTAGLRGRIGAGPGRMNTAVVTRAAAALGGYVAAQLPPGDARPPAVVVGHDARTGSATFARDSAAVLTAAGCRVLLVDRPVPTPVVAAAVRRLDADAGVVVTASHNPPADNGYKVYLGGRVAPGPTRGVQIVPPADAAIAERIAACPPAAEVARADSGWTVLGDEAVADYVAATAPVAGPGPRRLRVVATAMHGVGADVLDRVLAAAGFAAPDWVASQRDPDPAFPTVAFPNPEVPGAMDAAMDLAREVGADLVVALDPDADRCAVAVPDPGTAGGWRRLTGDELGALLGEHLIERGAAPADPGEPAAVACSLVSSSLLGRIAGHHGVRFAATLTGFKWIARVPGLVYGYEEAIGYCVDPATVRDKDGIATATVVCGLAASLRERGLRAVDVLDELAVRHGVHLTAPVTVRLEDPAEGAGIVTALLSDPPATLGGLPVTRVEDLGAGVDGLPPTPGLRLRSGGDVRVVVRPSGTEPLLKAYLEVVRPVTDAGALRAVRAEASALLTAVRADVTARLAARG